MGCLLETGNGRWRGGEKCFIHSSIDSFIDSFIHPSIHPSIHSFIHRFIHSSIDSSIHSSIHSTNNPQLFKTPDFNHLFILPDLNIFVRNLRDLRRHRLHLHLVQRDRRGLLLPSLHSTTPRLHILLRLRRRFIQIHRDREIDHRQIEGQRQFRVQHHRRNNRRQDQRACRRNRLHHRRQILQNRRSDHAHIHKSASKYAQKTHKSTVRTA